MSLDACMGKQGHDCILYVISRTSSSMHTVVGLHLGSTLCHPHDYQHCGADRGGQPGYLTIIMVLTIAIG